FASAELACFIAGKENDPPGLFAPGLKHQAVFYRWLTKAFTAIARGSLPSGIMVSIDGGRGKSERPLRSISDNTERSPLPVFTTSNIYWFGEKAIASGRLPTSTEPVRLPVSML